MFISKQGNKKEVIRRTITAQSKSNILRKIFEGLRNVLIQISGQSALPKCGENL